MRPLFVTYACDFCDGLTKPGLLHRGFVVWRGLHPTGAREEYVFPTRADADRYRSAARLCHYEIREVLSETQIHWHPSRGTIRGLDLADHLYTIYPDHRFEPGPYRAFLAP
jgi:hypothetical protein